MRRNNLIWNLSIYTAGAVIGLFRGQAARQKWLFRIRRRHEEKRRLSEQKRLLREGGVVLDDIELAAFHK